MEMKKEKASGRSNMKSSYEHRRNSILGIIIISTAERIDTDILIISTAERIDTDISAILRTYSFKFP